MNERPRHWLNPQYRRSETDASTCRQKSTSSCDVSPHTTSSSFSWGTEPKMKSILACLPKSWAKLHSLTSSLSSILNSRIEQKNQKQVVMEGVIPTTRESLMNFLKGMGLRPKVELVGQETIISADMSAIHDDDLKKRFLNLIKMHVIYSPALTNADTTTDTTVSCKKTPSIHQENGFNNMDALPPGQFKPDTPDEPPRPGIIKNSQPFQEDSNPIQDQQGRTMDALPPGPFKPNTPGDDRQTQKQQKSPGGRRQAPNQHKSPGDSKPAQDKHKSPGDDKLAQDRHKPPSGARKPVHDQRKSSKDSGQSPEQHKSPRGSLTLPPGPFKPENPGEDLPPGPFKPGRSLGINDLPPVPWGPKMSGARPDSSGEKYPQISSAGPNSTFKKRVQRKGNDTPFEGQSKKEVNFASMHQKQHITPTIDFWNDYPSSQQPTSDPVKLKNKKGIKKTKPKKLRLMKHLRRWFITEKKTVTPCVSSNKMINNNTKDSRSNERNPHSERSRQEDKPVRQSDGKRPQSSHRKPPIGQDNIFSGVCTKGKQTTRFVADKKPVEACDGSISMPVLIIPDKSCFKMKRPPAQELAEGSKSSTRAVEPLVEEPTSYSVVGNSAAIHIAKNRIRLEGNDVKYGSILHKDKHFDDHFKVLEENSMQDIEYQVNKVKERIMFARYSKGY